MLASPLDMPEEVDVCCSSPCPGFGVGYHWGMQGVVAFFSEFTIPVARKASWLLNFGTGVLTSCVAWDIKMSACFHTVQDLLGGLVRARTCLRSLAFLFEEILHFVILRPASVRSWEMALEAVSEL